MRACVRACECARVHARVRAGVRARARVCVFVYVRVSMCAYMYVRESERVSGRECSCAIIMNNVNEGNNDYYAGECSGGNFDRCNDGDYNHNCAVVSVVMVLLATITNAIMLTSTIAIIMMMMIEIVMLLTMVQSVVVVVYRSDRGTCRNDYGLCSELLPLSLRCRYQNEIYEDCNSNLKRTWHCT